MAPPVEAGNHEVAALDLHKHHNPRLVFFCRFRLLHLSSGNLIFHSGRKHICNAATMASVLSQRLFVAALSGGECNLWTRLRPARPELQRGRACTDRYEGICVRFEAFRDPRRLWESNYWVKKKKKEEPSIQPVNFPPG